MDLSEAFPNVSGNLTYSLQESRRHNTPGTTLDNAYTTLIKMREEDDTSIVSETSLDPIAFDSLKMATSFTEQKKELEMLNKKIETIEKSIKDVNDKFASMNESMQQIKIEWDSSGITLENSTEVMNCWDKFVSECKIKNDIMTTNFKNQASKLMERRRVVQENLRSMRKLIKEGLSILIPKQSVTNKLCSICFENEINTVLIPCGHTLCAHCSDNIGPSCMNCRQRINSKNAFFM